MGPDTQILFNFIKLNILTKQTPCCILLGRLQHQYVICGLGMIKKKCPEKDKNSKCSNVLLLSPFMVTFFFFVISLC